MKFFFIKISIVFLGLVPFSFSNESNNLTFVVLSDIHIYTSGRIPPKAKAVIQHIKNIRPDLVFITGDHTNGNRGDNAQASTIKKWYNSLDTLLSPLIESNIPIFPTVGNHDYYERPHKTAYQNWAKKIISKSFNLLEINQPKNYINFVFSYKNVEFFIFRLWKQSFGQDQINWINNYSSLNNKKDFRFGFGHVPLKSTMGKTSKYFYDQASEIFQNIGLDAYFCGHEHLHWDEINPKTSAFTQTIVGTASGTYNFPIKSSIAKQHCTEHRCLMPATKKHFSVRKRPNGAAEQINKQNWIVVKINDKVVSKKSYSLDENNNPINFYID